MDIRKQLGRKEIIKRLSRENLAHFLKEKGHRKAKQFLKWHMTSFVQCLDHLVTVSQMKQCPRCLILFYLLFEPLFLPWISCRIPISHFPQVVFNFFVYYILLDLGSHNFYFYFSCLPDHSIFMTSVLKSTIYLPGCRGSVWMWGNSLVEKK